jgi:nucleotide-binding universal stress UspA family protein
MWGLRLAEELVTSLGPIPEENDNPSTSSGDDQALEIEVFTVLGEDESQEPLSDAQLETFVADQLRHFAEESPGGPDITAQIEVRRGDPRSLVLAEIERRNPDLVVVGGSGKGRADQREKLGQVARQLALEAPSSVLFVPPRAAEALEATTAPEWQSLDPSDETDGEPFEADIEPIEPRGV